MLPIGNAKENMDLVKDKFLSEYIEVWKRKKKNIKEKWK